MSSLPYNGESEVTEIFQAKKFYPAEAYHQYRRGKNKKGMYLKKRLKQLLEWRRR